MSNRSKQHGLSLIEIMIALLIGAFLIGGIIQIFINSKQTYRMQEGLSRLQENGRFAISFLTRDIRMADFWGCSKKGLDNITNNLDHAGTGYDTALHGFVKGITGTNGVTDTITLRGAVNSGINVVSPFGPQASATLQITAGANLTQGEVVLVTDCLQGDIFQISNANPGSGVVVHNTGSATQPGNYNVTNPGCPGANAHCLSKVYKDDALIYKMQSITYSIQNGASGQPALFRSVNGTAVELIEGVENMQIFYGEDSDGDNTPNYYVDAGVAGLDMDKVISIRISLLLHSIDDNITSKFIGYKFPFGDSAEVTPTDKRLRKVFTSTIAVRNRLP